MVEKPSCGDFSVLKDLIEKSKATSGPVGNTKYEYATDEAEHAYDKAMLLAIRIFQTNLDNPKILFRLRDMLRTKGEHVTDALYYGILRNDALALSRQIDEKLVEEYRKVI